MVFTVWSGVTHTNMCFVKWSWKTKMLATLDDWFGFNVVTILVKSTCRRSRGVVATIGHKGALGVPPSYWRKYLQALIMCLICLAIPGYQKHSCNKDSVWSWPWCPTSWWHPFKVAVQCTIGTTKSNRSSFSPWAWSTDRGHLEGPWTFGYSSIQFGPPY